MQKFFLANIHSLIELLLNVCRDIILPPARIQSTYSAMHVTFISLIQRFDIYWILGYSIINSIDTLYQAKISILINCSNIFLINRLLILTKLVFSQQLVYGSFNDFFSKIFIYQTSSRQFNLILITKGFIEIFLVMIKSIGTQVELLAYIYH